MKERKKTEVKEFYNNIHHQYYDGHSHQVSCDVKIIHEKILETMRTSSKGSILDVGCASQEPVNDSVGCDISIEGMKIRKKLFPLSKAVCSDINYLPFRKKHFSGLLAGLLLDHIPNPADSFRSLHHISSADATLIVTVFDNTALPEKKYSNKELNYTSTNGESYSVPSYHWSKNELESFAIEGSWNMIESFVHETIDSKYKLLQLNFEKLRSK